MGYILITSKLNQTTQKFQTSFAIILFSFSGLWAFLINHSVTVQSSFFSIFHEIKFKACAWSNNIFGSRIKLNVLSIQFLACAWFMMFLTKKFNFQHSWRKCVLPKNKFEWIIQIYYNVFLAPINCKVQFLVN